MVDSRTMVVILCCISIQTLNEEERVFLLLQYCATLSLGSVHA
jgi:hypothetical protein